MAAGGIENYRAELSEQDGAWAAGLDKIAEHAEMGAFPVDAATIDLGASANYFILNKPQCYLKAHGLMVA